MAEPNNRTEHIRTGATPLLETGELMVDCSTCGEVGRVPFGGDEFGALETAFAQHLTEVRRRG